MALGIILSVIAGVMGLIYAKLWDKAFVPKFAEDIDDDEEDRLLAEWVKSYMKREDRKIGFYRIYQWDLKETWHTTWYFQFMKYFKVNILRYRTPKRKRLF